MPLLQTVAKGLQRVGLNKIANRLTDTNRTYVQIFGRAHIAGVWLSHEEAVRLSAVWACVCVISKAIASSVWDVMLETPDGDRQYQKNSRAHFLFNVRPNREMTPVAFHEMMIAVALLWGNSYAEIERDIMNRPIALWPLDPHRCWLVRGMWISEKIFLESWTGELALRVLNYDKPATYLHYEDVYHIHGLGFDGARGLDLVGVGARSFLQSLATERFALKYYENGTSMGGVLSTEKDIDQEDLNDLRNQVKGRVGGVNNAFEFLVVSGGMKWESLSSTLEQGQYNEGRYFLIEETCRWFGVPPHKIAHLLRATFSNVEQQGIEFQRDCLTPWAIRCQQEADYKILPSGVPLVIRINLDWAAEGDAMSKAQTDAVLVSNGLANRNERRRVRGQNSMGPEGDVFTVQAQLISLTRFLENDEEPEDPEKATSPGTESESPINPIPSVQPSAARELLIPTMRRILRRQTNRAMEARRVAKTSKDFAKRIDAGMEQHLAYAIAQLQEMIEVCSKVGIKFSPSLLGELKNCCVEERLMLLAAFNRIERWCNVEERALIVATKLADMQQN